MHPFAAYPHSPLTVGLHFLLAGYYTCYYASVFIKSHETKPAKSDNKPTLITWAGSTRTLSGRRLTN
ncbi:MAG TPA: hypothetical protein VJS89_10900 [Gammaproteobacteria bacterium]|nr:hypothetical protein [Gammaproteobacteria bacterium]